MALTFAKWHVPSFRRSLVGSVALVLITIACGQEHQISAGPTIPESSPPSPSSSALPPSTDGLVGLYRGHLPFALVFASSGEAHTVWLEIAPQGQTLRGNWYVQGSCCEGGVVSGTFDNAAGSVTFGTLKLRLFSIDFDLGLDAALTSADGSSFAGQIFFCQNDECSDRRGGTGRVTFIRQ
jgi:hypothetical protein